MLESFELLLWKLNGGWFILTERILNFNFIEENNCLFLLKISIMFSSGQLIFAGCFVVVFVIATFYAYKGDKALHKKFYSGSSNVLIGFIAFVVLLFLIKIFFKH